MNATELLGVFRAEVDDLAAPYLWTDALVYTYIDDAQKQFCRDTDGIEDARTFTVAVLANGTEWYPLDAKILKLRSAVDSVTGKDIPLVPVEKMVGNNLRFDGAKGPLRALITGLEKGFVRTVPVPNAASTVNLRVFRLPAAVTATAPNNVFEIAEQHVLNLLLWAKYRAYDNQDSDAHDAQKAANYLARWNAYCARAKVEANRLRHSAGSVVYGGL